MDQTFSLCASVHVPAHVCSSLSMVCIPSFSRKQQRTHGHKQQQQHHYHHNNEQWGLCKYVIFHTILGGSPVILWISLGGKPKWLPLKFGYHDVMRTSPIHASLVSAGAGDVTPAEPSQRLSSQPGTHTMQDREGPAHIKSG